jgi:predicted Rossmann-fold nucleotide-binding protein
MAWGLARLYFGHHKPLILYGKFWKKIMKTFRENMMIRPEEMRVFKIVNSADEVLEALEDFEKEIQEGKHSEILKTSRNEYSI